MKPSRVVFILLIFVTLFVKAEEKKNIDEAKKSLTIKEINTAVDVLEERISKLDKALPVLKVEYDFHDATEGVPPDLKFFYETKKVNLKEKSVLRVFKTHVGREIQSIDRIYYFDENGQAMKFLEVNSGISGESGFPSSRRGIIYDRSGNKIWSSPEAEAPISFKDVSKIFDTLEKGLGKFQ